MAPQQAHTLEFRDRLRIGGGLGAMLRHFVNLLCARSFGTAFPWGTFIINITGSTVMAVLTALDVVVSLGMFIVLYGLLLVLFLYLLNRETGKPLEVVLVDIERDNWMSPEEAVAYGLVSRIIQNRSELG